MTDQPTDDLGLSAAFWERLDQMGRRWLRTGDPYGGPAMTDQPSDWETLRMSRAHDPATTPEYREALDDLIDQWHDGDDPRPLHEALGMTAEEYAAWVERNSIPQRPLTLEEGRKSREPWGMGE